MKFSSITLNNCEARFSQPKRELFRLKRALEANEYLLLGCRKLVIETDARYIHGMLNHLKMGLNAMVNRWIEKILMFYFKLRHVDLNWMVCQDGSFRMEISGICWIRMPEK